MSRIKTSEFGILSASYIRQLPVELHQPLIHVFMNVISFGDYDSDEHMRRLIEVNIPRGSEKYIQNVEKRAKQILDKYFDENVDAYIQINILKDLVFCKTMSERIKNDEKEEIYNGVKH